MIKIVTFISTSIIQFISTLNTVMIPETNLSLLSFIIMLTATKMIFAFIFEFFRMQRNFREQQFKVNRHKFNTSKKVGRKWKKIYILKK